jgi:2-C-methyl-D-erythritol 4-phosphate cytidylyltransferase
MTLIKPQADLSIVIPAAGVGERLGLGPKALLELNGQPLVTWITRKALKLASEVIVTAPPGYHEHFQQLCPGCIIIDGGDTRQSSVEKLARAATRPYLIIHDVARPFASLQLFVEVFEKARSIGCSGAFLTPDIPVAVIENGLVVGDYRRDQVGIFQAPQAFKRDVLIEIIDKANQNNWQEQSTLQLALRAGIQIAAVEGEKNNIKLTTPEDWGLAQHLQDLL